MTKRPDLTAAVTKPDVLVRLREWSARRVVFNVGDSPLRWLEDDLADAIAVIEGLREACARRLAMIEDLKRDLADARPTEGR